MPYASEQVMNSLKIQLFIFCSQFNYSIEHAPTFWDNKYKKTRDTADHHEQAVRDTATKTKRKTESIQSLQMATLLKIDECPKCLSTSKKYSDHFVKTDLLTI